jgi:membrane fusion protein, multidrug efflux system
MPLASSRGVWLAVLAILMGWTGTAVAQQPAAPAAPPAVPVSTGTVERQDVPLWLRGLAAVQPLYSVQLRTRVDGTLQDVPVTEGQDVKAGDVIAIIDPRPYQAALDAAVAKKAQDEAQLASARADVARYTNLTHLEVASRQKLEQVIALANQLIAAIAADDANVAAAKLNLDFCRITAPFDSRVGLRNVDPGNFVRAAEATPLLSLAQIQPIAATFTLPQDVLPQVQAAMAQGALTVVAFASDDRTQLDTGALLTVDNSIDPGTGTIKLKAIFPNPQRRLWPGQFINARLLAAVEKGAITVPTAAVMHSQTGLYVYTVKPDQTVGRENIDVSRENANISVVTKGLEPGQTVVTDGQSRLQAGSRVTIIPSKPAAANPTAQTGG